ncbi:Spo0E family sporulation regulatory protein-aspartic acid phosphatase [Halalkalibacterium ligniniphilum]|uniref:Spo0E family sporulation regulatory protein-aspartic acid phosphatase n=1 Tax=Halalkalibacterium ligniniphilum TaxID=1134413 RepID=UPI00034CF978|nr:Spo0E family sporulation regulatory protein-aspartic acid phosphatase [Halalkalibacterium ligniniphilum]
MKNLYRQFLYHQAQLEKLANSLGLNHPNILKKSQELDKIHMKIINKKERINKTK